MKKVIFLFIMFMLTSFCYSTKPKVATTLSVWGKLIEQSSDQHLNLIIQTYFINGKTIEQEIEIKTKLIVENLEVGRDYFFIFSLFSNQKLWDLRIVEKGFNGYQAAYVQPHYNDLYIRSHIEVLREGKNIVPLVLHNQADYTIDLKLDEIKLINWEAIGNPYNALALDRKTRINNADTKNYEITLNTNNVVIKPRMMEIIYVEVFLPEDYNYETTYYLSKGMGNRELVSNLAEKNSLGLWCAFEFEDNLGNKMFLPECDKNLGIISASFRFCKDNDEGCLNPLKIK